MADITVDGAVVFDAVIIAGADAATDNAGDAT